MTDLKYTGERLVPSKSPLKSEVEHRARYEFACKYIKGRRVLDIGCGEGYGSHMMSYAAKTVIGVDISEQAIKHAEKTYTVSNLDYTVADVTKLPFSDNEFTACVCFEVIEHIKNPGALLSEAARVLDPSGVFIVSTPNGAVRVSSQPNPFHIKEFALDEFSTLIRKWFPKDGWNLTIYGQFTRGKHYSRLGVLMKNIYLSLKGSLGIRPKPDRQAGESGKQAIDFDFDFEIKRAELAEYLVAIINPLR